MPGRLAVAGPRLHLRSCLSFVFAGLLVREVLAKDIPGWLPNAFWTNGESSHLLCTNDGSDGTPWQIKFDPMVNLSFRSDPVLSLVLACVQAMRLRPDFRLTQCNRVAIAGGGMRGR